MITRDLYDIANIREPILELLEGKFGIAPNLAEDIYLDTLDEYFHHLIDDIVVLVEYPYVDRMYRNSYYYYFSKKLKVYERDCVRLSFFKGKMGDELFKNYGEEDIFVTKYEELKLERYQGFLVVRPTPPHIIGRNAVSLEISAEDEILTVSCEIQATANNSKFSVKAFPHASQDTESITCAETALWATMEYFSNKYQDYKPVLPSQITKTLQAISMERQMPSSGLYEDHLSFALKEYGFGPRRYNPYGYGEDHELEQLVSAYIESGIPIIMSLEGTTAHTIVCIGRKKISAEDIEAIPVLEFSNEIAKEKAEQLKLECYDVHYNNLDYVFIDDNEPPYKCCKLNEITPREELQDEGGVPSYRYADISSIIVPLYKRIHLDYFEAKKLFQANLFTWFDSFEEGEEVVTRLFLMSSRSFKEQLKFSTFAPSLKSVMLDWELPKFIWVGEISNKEKLKRGKAHGLVVMDATEANHYTEQTLIFGFMNTELVTFLEDHGKKEKIEIPTLPEFDIFTNNLNGF